MNADDMRVTYGSGPSRTRCQDCANLRPTTSEPRPGDHTRHRRVTLFHCVASQTMEPWSLLHETCGRFQEAQ